ncbi:Six-hairpin glycosidase [Penicillium argentinense]|uniref:Six-hairpin glycosidase n=1 Tax=Penicillium argentinense TaxID=1131581 RepID=A0A9W9G687_9EURO|nr:Six-hairpin glycosidase [Penicillium argentinense]KAJ5112117.1 Six-hairpin glycosidase [Penicillium argentinense]
MEYPQERFLATTFIPGSFWARRREVVRAQTLRHQLLMLKQTGRYEAFKLQWHPSYAEPPTVYPIPNHQFWDSDVAKWIEGACYLLVDQFDEEIDAAVRELVQMIRGAQHPDGYLNIHYSVVEPGKRFTNLRDMHELYNAGHLIEGALAHHLFYKNDEMLAPILKYVDLLAAELGAQEGQIPGYPGHPEIELALLRLHRLTGDPKHLRLARFFIEERGNPHGGKEKRHYYDVEAEARGESEHDLPMYFPAARSYWYQQAHVPIADQETIEGHSVRAMYLLTAVADLVRIFKPDSELGAKFLPALHRLWSNMVEKKAYVTGGIGAMKKWEGFGGDYFLPQGTDEGGCYAETCAAIGVMMLAERLLQFELKGEYADMMELCLYNAVLTGMSLDGKAFTYVNQLASSDQDLSQRHEWFECACCPPNVTRTLGFLGGYIWSHSMQDDFVVVNVHLYTSASLNLQTAESTVQITQTTDWPWDGDVTFDVKTEGPQIKLELRLRIAGWAASWQITPRPDNLDIRDGYVYLDPAWVQAHAQFRFSCPMQPRVVRPHPLTMQPVAYVMRGPIVYCVEDVDHPWEKNHFKRTIFDSSVPLREETRSEPDSYVALIAEKGVYGDLDTSEWEDRIVAESGGAIAGEPKDLCFIPYYLRANRGGRGQMRVGLRLAF